MTSLTFSCGGCEAPQTSPSGLRSDSNMVVLNKSKDSVTENYREDWGRPAESVSPSLRPFAHQGPSAGGGESLALRRGRSARPSIPMLAVLAQRKASLRGGLVLSRAHTLCQGSFGYRRQRPFCGNSSEALVLLGAAVDAKFRSLQHPQLVIRELQTDVSCQGHL